MRYLYTFILFLSFNISSDNLYYFEDEYDENRFNNLIKDPTVSRDVLNQVIKKISDSFNLEVLFRNFLSFLIIKRRFFYIQQILKSFNSICLEKRGELKDEIK